MFNILIPEAFSVLSFPDTISGWIERDRSNSDEIVDENVCAFNFHEKTGEEGRGEKKREKSPLLKNDAFKRFKRSHIIWTDAICLHVDSRDRIYT